MSDFDKIETSAEVWAVIKARHPDMRVFGSFSNPNADPRWGSDECEMYTEYGFEDAATPTLAARTTWTKHPEDDYKRDKAKTVYWLCFAREMIE